QGDELLLQRLGCNLSQGVFAVAHIFDYVLGELNLSKIQKNEEKCLVLQVFYPARLLIWINTSTFSRPILFVGQQKND
ncbi:MAG: hypothetical protein IKC66_01670, partial [Alistipes sp.]|nr:hypothetical protein [Alistipes sp.]